MLVVCACFERSFEGLELAIPIEKPPPRYPMEKLGEETEQREADGYSGHHHRNCPLYMNGQPQRQMSLHERRTILVKIGSGRGNQIFGVGPIGEFAAAVENIRPAMDFLHCLQQELDNLRVKIAANQNLRRGCNQLNIR